MTGDDGETSSLVSVGVVLNREHFLLQLKFGDYGIRFGIAWNNDDAGFDVTETVRKPL